MLFNKQILDHSSSAQSDPLNCDRWVASSLLQKAIRRGDFELAQRAARRLMEFDKNAIWRRVVVIAFEDVGAADIDPLLETVFVASSSEWRRGCGELTALDRIVRQLAEATKDRSADYLACAARDHPDLSEICDFCRKASLGERLRLLADTSLPLAKRGVAAWFGSDINWRYDRQVQGGNLRALAEAYRELGAGEELANSMVLAAKRAPEPLVVLAPLIWFEVQRSGPATTRNGPVPQTKTIAGVPLYAFDKHTRIGKRAIERLVRENKPLRDCIIWFLAKGSPK